MITRKFIRILTFTFVLGFFAPLLFSQEDVTKDFSEAQKRLYKSRFGIVKKKVDAPGFTLVNLDGEEVSLSDHEGKVVLLNLWATWCPPCRAEMPSMEELSAELPDNDFVILAVAAPNTQRESEEKIRGYIEDNEFTFPVLLDKTNAIFREYGTGSIPTSWIIDTDGSLYAILKGKTDWMQDDIVSALKMLTE